MRYKPIGRAAQIKYITSLFIWSYYVDDNILETRRQPTLLLRRRPYYNDTIIFCVPRYYFNRGLKILFI